MQLNVKILQGQTKGEKIVTRGYFQISQYMEHSAGYNEVKSNVLKRNLVPTKILCFIELSTLIRQGNSTTRIHLLFLYQNSIYLFVLHKKMYHSSEQNDNVDD